MGFELSLIIPSYNVEKYVARAIRSVAEQTLDSSFFETVIVDDGSTDSTPSIIKNEMGGMKDVTYRRRNKNLGVAFTRNEAISLSSGNLIALLDADDFLSPNALESTLNFHKLHTNVRYSYSGYIRVDENGLNLGEGQAHDYCKNDLLRFNFVSPLTCFYKKVHGLIGGFDSGTMVEDWDHALKASEVLDSDQIASNPQPLYYYRIHNESRSIAEVQKTRNSAVETLTNALNRRGVKAKVKFSHKNGFGHTHYDYTVLEEK